MTTTEFAHHARHSAVYRPREARHGDRSSREHENSKNLPAGSNPSKRHLADPGIIVPSDQENPDQGNSRQVGTFREGSEVRWGATSPQVQFDRNTATVLIASTIMSLMQAQRQEYLKYPASTLLKSSNDLGWSTLTAELRSHSRYEGPGAAPPRDAEVGIIVRGSDQGLLTYKFAGNWQSVLPTMGSIRLRPIGRADDEVRICSKGEVEVLHLYVPTVAFAPLIDDYNLPPVPARSMARHCESPRSDPTGVSPRNLPPHAARATRPGSEETTPGARDKRNARRGSPPPLAGRERVVAKVAFEARTQRQSQ